MIGFSVLVGVAILSLTAADYWGEASAALAQDRAIIESAIVWLPYFKLLGLGITLGAIVMALGPNAHQGFRKAGVSRLGWIGQARLELGQQLCGHISM